MIETGMSSPRPVKGSHVDIVYRTKQWFEIIIRCQVKSERGVLYS